MHDADGVSSQVILISQPIAYDEEELPEVANRWYRLYPFPGREKAYFSNRSVATGVRANSKAATDTAQTMGVQVIRLDEHMRPMLRFRDDLFDDKWHFTAAGAEVAAEYVSRRLALEGSGAETVDKPAAR